MTKSIAFTYLQIYSRVSPFGGLSEAAALAEGLQSVVGGSSGVAAALTDTFGLAGSFVMYRHLAESGIRPLWAAEVGVSLAGPRSWPYALVLVAESRAGYINLCRLVSWGLKTGGSSPLTAAVSLDDLQAHKSGLIAISPYYGGPVMSALRLKASEAKTRLQTLRDVFGPENFYLGLPPVTAKSELKSGDSKLDALIKLHAALVKLGRDNKVGLVGTGETRYLQAEDAAAYAVLRNRSLGTLRNQYPASLLQQQPDWLYAPNALRPPDNLQLRPPAELINFYNNSDWPDGLANNRAIGLRAASWDFDRTAAMQTLRQKCEDALADRLQFEPALGQHYGTLEAELASVEELGLAEAVLAVAKVSATEQLSLTRSLSGSLIGFLLGIAPKAGEFKLELTGGPLTIEVGREGRARLLASLNQGGTLQAAAVGVTSSQPGEVPLTHLRRTLVATGATDLAELVPLQPDAHGINVAQLFEANPPETANLEIAATATIARLQLALDSLNSWRTSHGQEPLARRDLPQTVEASGDKPFDEVLLSKQLDYVKLNYPAAYYAAALTMARPEQRTTLAETVRRQNLKILPPDIRRSQPDFTMLDEATILSGLACLDLGVLDNFNNLDDFAAQTQLDRASLQKLIWAGALDSFGARESLDAATETIIERGETARRYTQAVEQPSNNLAAVAAPTSGQMSLFDLFESAAPETTTPNLPPAPEPIKLIEVSPLSSLERLRRQYAALGFATCQHPLWVRPTEQQEPSDILELAPVLHGDSLNGQALRVAGMIIGVRRLPFANGAGGQELTVLRLEDWSGQAEVLVPPGTPAEQVVLEEGLAITGLVRRVIGANQTVVLVADALATYPPRPGDLIISDDEAADLAIDSDGAEGLPPVNNAAPADEESWATSLFAEYDAQPASPLQNPPSKASATNGKSKKNAEPVNNGRSQLVEVTIFMDDDPARDDEKMLQMMELLRSFPGPDLVQVNLNYPDGNNPDPLRPNTLRVQHGPALEQAVTRMVGPEGYRVRPLP